MKAYDERRDELIGALKQCRDVKETADCAALFLDKIGRETLAEADSREERAEIERLFSAARCALACMQAVTKADVTVTRRPQEKAVGWARARELAPYAAILLGAVLCVWLILAGEQAGAAMCVALMALSLLPQREKRPQEEVTATPRADEYELIRQFDRLIDRLDALMSARRAEREERLLSEADEPLLLSKGLLEPIQMLMEAAETQDGRYALKTLPKVREALRAQGVQALDFSQENQAYFEMFPSEQGGRTIRPALLRGGKLILRGQATESIR